MQELKTRNGRTGKKLVLYFIEIILKLVLKKFQERSLKTQNAALEKKQHESWVTVRQETRKLTEAQNEMQTLRARLTVAETKLAEKTVEIESIMTENQAMKETMDRINNHQLVKPDSSKYFHEKKN